MGLTLLYLLFLVCNVNSEFLFANSFVSELKEVVGNKNLNDRTIPDSCTAPLYTYLDSILKKDFQLWQIKMADASTKLPSGILAGNIVDLGHFDECIEIKEYLKEINDTIYGKFCDLVIKVPLGTNNKIIDELNQHIHDSQIRELFYQKSLLMDKHLADPTPRIINLSPNEAKLRFSWCIPSGCDEKFFNDIFHNILNMSMITMENCQAKYDEPVLEAGDWIFIAFLIIILLLIIASTTYDVYIERTKKRRPHIAYFAFSVYSNGKKLISTSTNPNTLPCLNGIRFLSMVWVILGHAYFSRMYTPIVNAVSVIDWSKKVMAMTLLGATVSVDTFFVLGGLVMVYVFMMAHEKGIKFNVLFYYLHRYIRLTPALAFVMLFHMTLLRFCGSGPLWPDILSYLEMNCTKYWWSVLLYVQNYVNPNEQCLGQTWYLSVDMQLFLISPLILYPLARWPKWTIRVLYLGVILGVIAPFIVGYEYALPGLITVAIGNADYMPKYYINTYIRFGPWLVGIILGYYVHTKNENRRFNNLLKIWWFNLLGWILSLGILAAVVYGPNNLLLHDYNKIESSMFLGFHRVAWSIGMSWLIYACIMGHGGFINWFLSLTPFQVLARLTYSMYLTHLSFQFVRVAIVRAPQRFTDFEILHNFFGDFIYTLFMALIVTLAFESPMITVEKIIFGNVSKKTESKENILDRGKSEKNHEV